MSKTQFLSILVAGLLIAPALSLALKFSDVPADNPYELPIHILRDYGVVIGFPDNTYRPQEYLTRGIAARVVLGAYHDDPGFQLDIPDLDPAAQFKDMTVANPYAKYLVKADQMGIWSPDADGNYLPNAPITRAEFMKLILVPSRIDLAPFGLQQYFSDVPTYAWFAPYMNFAGKYGLLIPDKDKNLYPSQYIRRGKAAETGYLLYVMLQANDNWPFLIPQIEQCAAKALDYMDYKEPMAAKRIASFAVGFAMMLYNSDTSNVSYQNLAKLAKATLYSINYLSLKDNAESSSTATGWLNLAKSKLVNNEYINDTEKNLETRLKTYWPQG